MFLVEPMIARMVLPLLGGAPSVWNTCLVFFQAVLLCGYAYAHGATRLGVRRHVPLHVLMMLLPLAVLPIGLLRVADPFHSHPVAWLFLALLVSIGLPFFALSTSAAVLQKWYSTTDDGGGRDPYFLYAASNLGSFIALLAYPLIVEPTLRLRQQSVWWSVGYGVLIVLTTSCAAAIWRRGRRDIEPATVRQTAEPIGWARRLRWVALAFAPSSLLLAVTSYIATDVASVPLLWVGPLSIYLMTFVVAFSPSAVRARALARRFMPLAVIVITVTLIAQMNQPLSYVIPVHLGAFAIVALFCHGELAQDRPSPARLTEFFLWIALGGMLGGLFNALVAPVLFVGVAEYPLVLALTCALRRPEGGAASEREGATFSVRDIMFAAVIGLVATGAVLVNNHYGSESRYLIVGAGVPAVIAFGQQRRPIRFVACVAALLLSGAFVESAFGRVRVFDAHVLRHLPGSRGRPAPLPAHVPRFDAARHAEHAAGAAPRAVELLLPDWTDWAGVRRGARRVADGRGRGSRPRRWIAGKLRGPGAALDLLRDRPRGRAHRQDRRIFHVPGGLRRRGVRSRSAMLGSRWPGRVRSNTA